MNEVNICHARYMSHIHWYGWWGQRWNSGILCIYTYFVRNDVLWRYGLIVCAEVTMTRSLSREFANGPGWDQSGALYHRALYCAEVTWHYTSYSLTLIHTHLLRYILPSPHHSSTTLYLSPLTSNTCNKYTCQATPTDESHRKIMGRRWKVGRLERPTWFTMNIVVN